MAKKKEEVKSKKVQLPAKIKYRCNICGKINDEKKCCGNDFTTKLM